MKSALITFLILFTIKPCSSQSLNIAFVTSSSHIDEVSASRVIAFDKKNRYFQYEWREGFRNDYKSARLVGKGSYYMEGDTITCMPNSNERGAFDFILEIRDNGTFLTHNWIVRDSNLNNIGRIKGVFIPELDKKKYRQLRKTLN